MAFIFNKKRTFPKIYINLGSLHKNMSKISERQIDKNCVSSENNKINPEKNGLNIINN